MVAPTTTDFYIKPEDNWVLLATAPAFVYVKPGTFHPWYLAVAASSPPLNGETATGTVTITALPADGGTVTIGSQVYTLKTTLTPTAGEVLLGADQAATATNLIAAITGGAGSGTLYAAGTPVNTLATAVTGGSGIVTVSAKTAGATGNTVVFTESATNLTVSGSGFLSGGTLPLIGIENRLNHWEYGTGAVALGGNVYARIRTPDKDDRLGGLRLSVVAQTV